MWAGQATRTRSTASLRPSACRTPRASGSSAAPRTPPSAFGTSTASRCESNSKARPPPIMMFTYTSSTVMVFSWAWRRWQPFVLPLSNLPVDVSASMGQSFFPWKYLGSGVDGRFSKRMSVCICVSRACARSLRRLASLEHAAPPRAWMTWQIALS